MSIENIITLSAFGFYALIMIGIGFFYSKSTKNNEDYFLGGRDLGGWTAAISAEASDMSGWLLMGLPGSIYLAGTGQVWVAVGLLIGTILNWYIVASRLRKYTIVANNSLTIPAFFDNRFRSNGILRVVSAVIITFFFAIYAASGFSSGAKLFVTLFADGTNNDQVYLIGLIIASVVILVYTFLGGFMAVCVTDLIQGMMMLVAILSVPIIAYSVLTYETPLSEALVANGIGNPDSFLNFFHENGEPIKATTIISGLAWGLGYFGMPHILVRFMAIKNETEMKKSRKIAITWVVLSFVASILIGIVGRAYVSAKLYEGASDKVISSQSETVFIRMIQELLSGNYILIFIGGVFLCGILAAIMSTADSQLLVTSSAVSEDIYSGVIKKDASAKTSLRIGKIAVVAVAVIAFFIALDPNSSIMDLVSNAWAGFGAAFGPVVLLGLFWKRSNFAGALAGMISGAVTVIVWDYIPMINGATLGTVTNIYSLAIGFTISTILMVVVSLCTKKPSEEMVNEFESIKTIDV